MASYRIMLSVNVWGILLLFYLKGLLAAQFKITQLGQNIIDTSYGKSRGILVDLKYNVNGYLHNVDVFKSIEYATLRDDLFRFFPSRDTVSTWNSVKLFNQFQPVCSQKVKKVMEENEYPNKTFGYLNRLKHFTLVTDEECLNLNIYLPVGKFLF